MLGHGMARGIPNPHSLTRTPHLALQSLPWTRLVPAMRSSALLVRLPPFNSIPFCCGRGCVWGDEYSAVPLLCLARVHSPAVTSVSLSHNHRNHGNHGNHHHATILSPLRSQPPPTVITTISAGYFLATDPSLPLRTAVAKAGAIATVSVQQQGTQSSYPDASVLASLHTGRRHCVCMSVCVCVSVSVSVSVCVCVC